MQIVLDNMSDGVTLFDKDFRLHVHRTASSSPDMATPDNVRPARSL